MNVQHRRPGLFRSAHWLLLGLVFSLALSFWLGDAWFGRKIEDAYNDPHRYNALKTFEQAIVATSADIVLKPPTRKILQQKFPCADSSMLERLSKRLQVLDIKLRSLSLPDKYLRINVERWSLEGANCLDVLEMTKWLAEDGGKHLDNMDWSGLHKTRSDRPPMRVQETAFYRANPWRGGDGCVYIGPLADQRLLYWHERRSSRESCPAMAPREVVKKNIVAIDRNRGPWTKDDPAWALPENIGTILADLNRIRVPEGITYGLYTEPPELSEEAIKAQQSHGPNRIRLHGRETEVGFNVFLTIAPKTQSLAQQWAQCYSGDRHACDILGVDSVKLSGEFYESAAVRMAAIVVLDVAGGKIEALGSAHTPCYKQDRNGTVHDADCPDTPFRPRYDPDRLLNHALFVDAMPASTIKPIIALGLLMDNSGYRDGAGRDALWLDIKQSNSKAFLDRLFCGREVDKEQVWQWRQCQRPQRVQESARLVGWNLECGQQGSPDCAELDVLFGRPVGKWIVKGMQKQPLGLPLLYGRLFTEPPDAESMEVNSSELDWPLLKASGNLRGFRLMGDFRFSYDFASVCSGKDWGGCKGAEAKISNEGWGQGNARATPLGVAGMLARMAAAANGAKTQAYPHLVERIGDAEGKPFPLMVERLAAPETVNIDPSLAALVLQGMNSHQVGGTAYSACKSVFGDGCEGINWIAGKTGTPTFSFDQSSLVSIAKKCPYNSEKLPEGCNMIPYKWYVAAFKSKSDANAPFDKVIAVLSERNWSKKSGLVQAPGDEGVNLSAELAFRIIKALHPEAANQPALASSRKKGES